MSADVHSSAFSRVLTQLPSAAQRERAHQARRELALGDNDALWGLLHVVHQYCQSLGPASTTAGAAVIAPAAPAVPRAVPTWMLVALGMAMQTLVMATSFYVGTRAAAPAAATPANSWLVPALSAIMAVPAGWIALAQLLPLLLHVARSGWLARTSDRPVGWALFSLSSLIAATLLGTIAWLILSPR